MHLFAGELPFWPFTLFFKPKAKTWPDPAYGVTQPSSIHLQLVTFTDGSRAYCAQRSGHLGYGHTELGAYRALFDAIELARGKGPAKF